MISVILHDQLHVLTKLDSDDPNKCSKCSLRLRCFYLIPESRLCELLACHKQAYFINQGTITKLETKIV